MNIEYVPVLQMACACVYVNIHFDVLSLLAKVTLLKYVSTELGLTYMCLWEVIIFTQIHIQQHIHSEKS